MCGGPEHLNPQPALSSYQEIKSLTQAMNKPSGTVESEHSFSILLELAADNDVEGFKQSICNGSAISEIGLWYGRQGFSKRMVIEHRTPLMVAAKYGSVDVVKLILSLSEVDVNLFCGPDRSTALHCAASGGSVGAVDVVKLLLLAGAKPKATDAHGHCPFDVIVAPPNLPNLKVLLKELLTNNSSACQQDLQVLAVDLRSSSPPLPSSPKNGSLSSVSNPILTPVYCKPNSINVSSAPEKKEYPIDPSLPDLKSSIYATDEFRMFSFKIRPCSRAYSHDWTECPFVHPGENARRRDPRKYHYSCVPCPEFRKGTCRRGDLCEYAHGVFECWLHPAQYRTRLCKDGTSCMRRVCFFAHMHEELRPLYASSGSAMPSPRSASAATVMDMAAALNMFPSSPSAGSAMSPTPFSPSMSPSGNGISHSSMAWVQQNIPTLHLPDSNLQMSRLRSSLNARDLPAEHFNMLQDFEMQQQLLLNDLSRLSQPHISTSSVNLSGRSKSLAPSNLDELFSAEVSSPRYSDQLVGSSVFPSSHKSALFNQIQQQQSMISPIKTNVFPVKNADHPFLQPSFGVSSPGMMSPRSIEPPSPMGSRAAALAHREKQQLQFRSFSSRDLGSNLPHDLGSNNIGSRMNSWSKWESQNGKVDWSVQGDELGGLRKSCSIGHNREEPDVSWVQSLVKESPSDAKENTAVQVSSAALSAEGSDSTPQSESSDQAVLGAWLEQLHLDQIVA
ncbi:zinc finger CCCH domain-containing protein 56 [Corylus avellana]|uniref:zinc finger CCCH domain-containing protein 56 n=1 Tax=Corylus avellana TaxID=13451 RepID=UPI001E21A0E4|nr:zinc finger CCCH domain-containing protein 56 [Corylus avellana]XP_059431202.1 zinc finger CCCH domain-containing protein 56 [Corylus avellana]